MEITTAQLFLLFAGFIIGLGAVSVIETLGFLGQRSPYFTEATIRAHRVTKPLIWIGMILVILASAWIYLGEPFVGVVQVHAVIAVVLVLNGSWLSFWLSPRLLKREREGRASELLPATWKFVTTISFCISIIGWWGGLILWCFNIT